MVRIFSRLLDFSAFCTFGAVAVWNKSCIFLRTGNPLDSHLWFSLIHQFRLLRIWAKITRNCGGKYPDHNVKPMGTTITCQALAGKTTALTLPKQCIIYGATIWYHFRFCKCSQSREILEKTYKHICKHDPSPFSIHCMTLASRIRRSASVCTICIDSGQFDVIVKSTLTSAKVNKRFPSSWTLFVAYKFNSLGRSYRKLNTTLCLSRQGERHSFRNKKERPWLVGTSGKLGRDRYFKYFQTNANPNHCCRCAKTLFTGQPRLDVFQVERRFLST